MIMAHVDRKGRNSILLKNILSGNRKFSCTLFIARRSQPRFGRESKFYHFICSCEERNFYCGSAAVREGAPLTAKAVRAPESGRKEGAGAENEEKGITQK